jgi:hypothetical protein
MHYIKMFEAKITLQRYNRLYRSDFSHGQDIPFAIKRNVIHRYSKPGNRSTESNPRRFGLSTDNSRRYRR